MTYRIGYEHRWASKTYYTQLRIDPLLARQRGRPLDDAARGATPASVLCARS